LSETLESGKDYTLSGYYRGVGCNKLGHLEWQFYSNNLGFNFSKDPLVQNSYQPIFLTPTANIDDVADDSQWYPFSLCFTAQGGENVLTIGDFYPSTDRNIQSVGCQPIGNHLFGSFVLVDNLVLEEAIGPFSSSPTVHYIQNKTYSQDETERGCSELHAGENVDASKVKGDVLITGGRNVNYYAKDLITLEDGFKIVDNDGVFVAQLVEACDNCYPDPYVAIDDPASGGRACKDRLETIQPINCGNSYTTSLLWSQTSGPPVSFQTPLSACTLQFIAPTAGTIVLRLTAFNSQGGSFYDDIEILVTPCADTRQGRGYTRGDQSRSANDGYDLVGTKSHTIEQINLYPNPVSDKMIIEGLNDGFESIQVSNYSGQVIYYSKTRSDKLDVGNLNPGIYLILIRQNDKVFTEKVVVE
ncbi:MAG: T9SS type A sorting domain-containing protein, partial [Vicingaceae bacterium]